MNVLTLSRLQFAVATSRLTLQIMLGVAVCLLPVVIGYQFWVYRKFREPLAAARSRSASY